MGPDHERRRDEYYAEMDRRQEEALRVRSLALRLRQALRVATIVGRSQAVHDLLAEADQALSSRSEARQTGPKGAR